MNQSGPSTFDHLKAILALPFMVLVVVPALILNYQNPWSIIPLHHLSREWSISLGLVILVAGLLLFIQSLNLFIKIGKGTLAPWNPTQNIVVKGLYRHVRNPMLIGVNLLLFAEALLFRSGNIMLFMCVFFILNHFHFIFKEEPDLVKRFGKEYQTYCKNVPRWIPLLKAWRPEDES